MSDPVLPSGPEHPPETVRSQTGEEGGGEGGEGSEVVTVGEEKKKSAVFSFLYAVNKPAYAANNGLSKSRLDSFCWRMAVDAGLEVLAISFKPPGTVGCMLSIMTANSSGTGLR